MSIFYSTLLLTCVNLLLRFLGTGFQVWLSGRIGPEGVGLLQLVLSVGALALVAGTAGIRTASMYLTAGELKTPGNLPWVLSGCFLYSVLCSSAAAAVLFLSAPRLARAWIGSGETRYALYLIAGFLPAMCLCGILTGYFTARNRIRTLAAVEVLEQLITMGMTAVLVSRAGKNTGRICCAVAGGSCLGGVVALLLLIALYLRKKPVPGPKLPMASRLLNAAVPLALADLLRTGLSTAETLMVPRRLSLHPGTGNPLAVFGMLTGMVFPLLMFPACILYGLGELLIPELARCHAAGSRNRVRYLVSKSLRITFLYGIFICTLFWTLAKPLCLRFYGSVDAGEILRRYVPLIPMLYCDAIVDAMTKGLGQQKQCVRYNILTGGMDVVLLFLILPILGMKGYFISFFITHLLNFLLSIRRLLKITGLSIPLSTPVLTGLSALISTWAVRGIPVPGLQILFCLGLLGSLLTLLGILSRQDLLWFLGLIQKRRPAEAGRPKTAD